MSETKDEITMFVCGQKCNHEFDGPIVEYDHGATVTCSKCGAWAVDVILWEGL